MYIYIYEKCVDLQFKYLRTKMWNQFLDEAKSERKYQNTPVIILGKKHSGKRSLVDSLIEISKTTIQSKRFSIDSNKMRLKGLAPIIDYTYLNVLDLNDPDYRTHSKLQIYMVEDTRNPQIYSQLQKPEVLKRAVVIMMLDFNNPWTFMEELDAWIRFLYELQKKAGLSIIQLETLAKKVQYHYNHYKEPEFDENGKLKKQFKFQQIQEDIQLDLPEGVLTNNIRLPFIVCVNKCDLQAAVLREQSVNKTLFVLYHLRKFCLQYGGTLIYTSIKNNSNLNILYEYILHRAYNMPLRFKPQLINEQSIFVPLGYDNPHLLQDSLLKTDVSKSYSEVITIPQLKKQGKEEIMVEDDSQYCRKYIQSFTSVRVESLQTQQSSLSQENTAPSSLKPTEAQIFFQKLLHSSNTGREMQNAQNDLVRHTRQAQLNKSSKNN